MPWDITKKNNSQTLSVVRTENESRNNSLVNTTTYNAPLTLTLAPEAANAFAASKSPVANAAAAVADLPKTPLILIALLAGAGIFLIYGRWK